MKSSEAIPYILYGLCGLMTIQMKNTITFASQMQKNTFQCMLLTIAGFIMKFNYREVRNKTAKILNAKLLLPLSLTELHILKEYGTSDQLETCMALKLLVDRCQISNPYAAINARVAIERLSPKQYLRFFASLESLKV